MPVSQFDKVWEKNPEKTNNPNFLVFILIPMLKNENSKPRKIYKISIRLKYEYLQKQLNGCSNNIKVEMIQANC